MLSMLEIVDVLCQWMLVLRLLCFRGTTNQIVTLKGKEFKLQEAKSIEHKHLQKQLHHLKKKTYMFKDL